jgi:hypothetical protein
VLSSLLFVAPRGVRHQITVAVSCALALRMGILWSLDAEMFYHGLQVFGELAGTFQKDSATETR